MALVVEVMSNGSMGVGVNWRSVVSTQVQPNSGLIKEGGFGGKGLPKEGT